MPFKEIADLVLSVNVGGYAIEMANPRHEHEWRVWEDLDLPDGQGAHPRRDRPHHERRRAPRARAPSGSCGSPRLVGRENVIGGTDCGFAQGPFVRRVHPSIMWAKLGALVEGAELATRQLWG